MLLYNSFGADDQAAHKDMIRCARRVPGTDLAVTGAIDGSVRVWNLVDQTLQAVMPFGNGSISHIAFCDTYMYCVGSGGRLVLWRRSDWTLDRSFNLSLPDVLTVVALDKNRVALSSSKSVLVVDTETGEVLRSMRGHTNQICTLALLQPGIVASGGKDHCLCIWDVRSGELLRKLVWSTTVRAITARDPATVLVGRGSQIVCYNWAEDVELWCTQAHRRDVRHIELYGEDHVVSVGYDRAIRAMNRWTGETVFRRAQFPTILHSVIVLSRNKLVVCGLGNRMLVHPIRPLPEGAAVSANGESQPVDKLECRKRSRQCLVRHALGAPNHV